MRVKKVKSVNLRSMDMLNEYERGIIKKIIKIRCVLFWYMLLNLIAIVGSILYMIYFEKINVYFIIGQILCVMSSVCCYVKLYDDYNLTIEDVVCMFTAHIGLLFIGTRGMVVTALEAPVYDDFINVIAFTFVLSIVLLFSTPVKVKGPIIGNIIGILQNIITVPLVYISLNLLYIIAVYYLDNNVLFFCFGAIYMFSMLAFGYTVRLFKYTKYLERN